MLWLHSQQTCHHGQLPPYTAGWWCVVPAVLLGGGSKQLHRVGSNIFTTEKHNCCQVSPARDPCTLLVTSSAIVHSDGHGVMRAGREGEAVSSRKHRQLWLRSTAHGGKCCAPFIASISMWGCLRCIAAVRMSTHRQACVFFNKVQGVGPAE